MFSQPVWYAAAALAGGWLLWRAPARLRLSRAKYPSLGGHAKLSRFVARLVPAIEYDEERFFASDDAPAEIVSRRKEAFAALTRRYAEKYPESIRFTERVEPGISDLQFTSAYQVPFPFRRHVKEHLRVPMVATASSGNRIQDLDGNWAYDLSGSYGLNVLGYDFLKECVDRGIERTRALGPVLGPYHPLIEKNVQALRRISGLDEVSFHMSGTEAVMQAVRLARYHTRREKLVRFCGAYHGWWDGVQPGVGNPRPVNDAFTLRDMDRRSLRVLETRRDIACVLINPLQAFHPNGAPQSDGTLIASGRKVCFDREAYTAWLKDVERVCRERSIPLVMDEVFVGFRLAPGGAQEYFGIRADLVTYGKTLGGGLPVGVLCGRADLMKRFREDRPADVCFARGTFNSHPYVMGAMNAFLERLEEPATREHYARAEAVWNERAASLNTRLQELSFPVRIANFASIWTVLYTRPSRYSWMFQFYLRAAGLHMGWTGTGRFILSFDYDDEAFDAVVSRFLEAAEAMEDAGWWWHDGKVTNRAIQKKFLGEMLRRVTTTRREDLGFRER